MPARVGFGPPVADPARRAYSVVNLRPRVPLLLGAAACAACCALPLAAVLIGAGTVATAVAILEPVAIALVALAIGLAHVAYTRRRRAAARCAAAGACATDRRCCGPTP